MLNRIFATLILTAMSTLPHASHAQEDLVNRLDQVKWQPAGLPGAEMAMLWGNDSQGTAVWAFRLQPGVVIPSHTHSRDYWGFAIQGKWAHIDAKGQTVITGQEAYVRIRANEPHADRCVGPEVCINILQFSGPRDIVFPAAQKKTP